MCVVKTKYKKDKRKKREREGEKKMSTTRGVPKRSPI